MYSYQRRIENARKYCIKETADSQEARGALVYQNDTKKKNDCLTVAVPKFLCRFAYNNKINL